MQQTANLWTARPPPRYLQWGELKRGNKKHNFKKKKKEKKRQKKNHERLLWNYKKWEAQLKQQQKWEGADILTMLQQVLFRCQTHSVLKPEPAH